MIILSMFIGIVLTFCEVYLIYLTLRIFSQAKEIKRRNKCIVFFIGLTLLYLPLLINLSPFFNTLILLFVIFLFEVTLACFTPRMCIWGIVIVVVNTITEVVAHYILLTTTMDYNSLFVIETFFFLALFLRFIFYIFMKSVILKKKLTLTKIVVLSIFFVLMVYFLVYHVWSSQEISSVFVISLIVLLCLDFFVLLSELLSEKFENEKLRIMSKNIIQKKLLTESYNQSFENMYEMVHDLNKHLLTIFDIAQSYEDDRLTEEIEKVAKMSNQKLIESQISDLYLETLFSYYDTILKKNKIVLNKIIDVPKNSDLFNSDFIQAVLLSLMEIGTEVAKNQKSKELEIKIFKQKNFYVINLVSDYKSKKIDLDKISNELLFLNQAEKKLDAFLNIEHTKSILDICFIYSER